MQVKCTCPGCGQEFEVSTTTSNPGGRPKPGTLTGKVWELADTLTGQLGARAPRKAVIEEGLKQGLNMATITTQYQRWAGAYKAAHPEQVAQQAQA